MEVDMTNGKIFFVRFSVGFVSLTKNNQTPFSHFFDLDDYIK